MKTVETKLLIIDCREKWVKEISTQDLIIDMQLDLVGFSMIQNYQIFSHLSLCEWHIDAWILLAFAVPAKPGAFSWCLK